MNKPNKNQQARELITRLSLNMRKLADCALAIGELVGKIGTPRPSQQAENAPPRRAGRPRLYLTKDAKRAAARIAYRRADIPIAKLADLRTVATMPRQPLQAGACQALGLKTGEIRQALGMDKHRVDNALYRFRQHAGLTSKREARDWFVAMHADPLAHSRLTLAELEAARALHAAHLKRVRSDNMRRAWQTRRRKTAERAPNTSAPTATS